MKIIYVISFLPAGEMKKQIEKNLKTGTNRK